MIRYRNEQWATYRVEKKLGFLKKLGRLITVKGYRLRSKRRGYENFFDYVMVKGENGTARLSSCQWGYSGSGPQLTRDVLIACGLSKSEAESIAFKSANLYPQVGTDWVVDLNDYTLTRRLKAA